MDKPTIRVFADDLPKVFDVAEQSKRPKIDQGEPVPAESLRQSFADAPVANKLVEPLFGDRLDLSSQNGFGDT